MTNAAESKWPIILCGILLVLLSGCQSPTMKGTPFYTGEYASRSEKYTDRVNLWPALYYRDPALSVFWPFFELTDEHTALRPIFSVYNKESAKPVYNICWPIARFDTGKQSNRIFPVYWGQDTPKNKDYFYIAPLYWHTGNPFHGNGENILFPLWIWSVDKNERELHLFWPIYADKKSETERLWRIWPIYGYDLKRSGSEVSRFWVWPLGGSKKSPEVNEHFLFPVYYAGNKGLQSDIWTLLGGRSTGPISTRWAILPALSWGGTSGSDSKNRYLLGLAGKHQTPDEKESYILPLYARRQAQDSSYFFSLPYSTASAADGSEWKATLPFFYNRTDKTGNDLLITPFYSRKNDASNNALWRCFFPLLYLNETCDAHFMTPLGGRWRSGNNSGWLALPILSGGVKNPDSGKTIWAGGLAGQKYGLGKSSHYILPLYYTCPDEDRFISLPYARWKSDDRTCHNTFPLLLSGTSRKEETVKTTLAAGIASWEKQADRLDCSEVLPLYRWKRGDYFQTLLYGKSKTSSYFMTPLIGRYLDKNGGWIFPLWRRETTARREETELLLGLLWNHRQATNSSRSSLALNLAFNTSQSRHADRSDPSLTWETRDFNTFLLLWNNQKHLTGPGNVVVAEHSSSGVFPLWSQCTDMPRNGDKTTETASLLLRLYDYRQETPRTDKEKTYTRHRILWRIYHKESIGADTSTDIFPAITIDQKENGFRKYSFLWRLFRYEKDTGNGTSKLDVLFVPLKR